MPTSFVAICVQEVVHEISTCRHRGKQHTYTTNVAVLSVQHLVSGESGIDLHAQLLCTLR
jgi:hypothetical protein